MSRRPNVLFIIADDHRHDAMRCAGDLRVSTPNMDRLAREGVRCIRHHTMGGMSAAVCVPSRAAVLTGCNPLLASRSRGVEDYAGIVELNPELSTLPQRFRQAGYHTFAAGKWHNCKRSFRDSFAAGSSIFFGGMAGHYETPVFGFDPTGEYAQATSHISEKHSTDEFGDAAIAFLREHDMAQPFFAWLAFTSPHDPRTPPDAYRDMYRAASIPLPGNYMDEHPFDNGELRIRDEELEAFPRTADAIRQHQADYYGMISHMDAKIGAILDELEARGALDDTIVVYTADHGLAVGQHGLLGKQNMYDHSIRVPLIVRGPGLPAGVEMHETSIHPDLLPTLCDWAGIACGDGVEGQSRAADIAAGQSLSGDRPTFTMYKHIQRAVSTGKWKLIRYYRDEKHSVGEDRAQLFNLEADPWELNDLIDDPASRAHRDALVAALQAWQVKVNDDLADRPSLSN